MPRILLIEDDKLLRPLLATVLSRAGHSVLEAGNGKDGLALAQTGRPDIVVTDLIMPDKEGLETIIELRRDFPDLPIIAMSGSGLGSHYLKAAEKLGAEKTLAKPFMMEELVQAVREVAHTGAPPPEPADRTLAFVVLDDSADNRFLQRRTLQKSFPGCIVIECDTVDAAVDQCIGRPVDAVLADHHLKGANGVTLVWRLRHRRVKCPILMVTGSTDETVRQQAYFAGVTEVFSDGNGEFVPYLREFFAKSASPSASSFHPSLAAPRSAAGAVRT